MLCWRWRMNGEYYIHNYWWYLASTTALQHSVSTVHARRITVTTREVTNNRTSKTIPGVLSAYDRIIGCVLCIDSQSGGAYWSFRIGLNRSTVKLYWYTETECRRWMSVNNVADVTDTDTVTDRHRQSRRWSCQPRQSSARWDIEILITIHPRVDVVVITRSTGARNVLCVHHTRLRCPIIRNL